MDDYAPDYEPLFGDPKDAPGIALLACMLALLALV